MCLKRLIWRLQELADLQNGFIVSIEIWGIDYDQMLYQCPSIMHTRTCTCRAKIILLQFAVHAKISLLIQQRSVLIQMLHIRRVNRSLCREKAALLRWASSTSYDAYAGSSSRSWTISSCEVSWYGGSWFEGGVGTFIKISALALFESSDCMTALDVIVCLCWIDCRNCALLFMLAASCEASIVMLFWASFNRSCLLSRSCPCRFRILWLSYFRMITPMMAAIQTILCRKSVWWWWLPPRFGADQ